MAFQTGLQRYDGHRFITYLSDLHNEEALQTDWISTIFEDSHKRLWFGTDRESAYLYNRNNGKFYNYNLNAHNSRNIINGIWKFCEDVNGDIWVCGHNHFFKLNSVTNQFENYDDRLGIDSSGKPSSITTDAYGNIWFTTTLGIKYLDIKKNILYDNLNNPERLDIFNIKLTPVSITIDEYNYLWVITANPNVLYKYNLKDNSKSAYYFDKLKTKVSLPSNSREYIIGVNKNIKGNLIVSLVTRGIALYDPLKDKFSIIDGNNEDPYGLHLTSQYFTTICSMTDREGSIWVGTDKGINIFNPNKQRFYTYGSRNNLSGGHFPDYNASGFLQTSEDGDVYVGYYFFDGGIVRLDSNLNFKKKYLYKERGDLSTIKNQIWCLYRDDDGIIWAPNQNKSILKLDPRKNEIFDYSNPLLTGQINTIKRDENADLWIGHWSKGLLKYSQKRHNVESFATIPGPKSTVIKNVSCIHIDKEGIIWVGTFYQGLFAFDKRKRRYIAAYEFEQANNHSISSNSIVSIIPYNDDTLVLATGAGIDIFDKRTKTFSVISSKDGLPNNLVETIALDHHNNLWAGFVGGFSKINIKTLAITNYGISDGILDGVFNNAPFLELRNGKFMVPGSKGFMVFNPDSVATTDSPPDVTITGFSVYGRNMNIDSILQAGKEISLSYKENNLRFEFASLEYSTPNKIKYYYRMDGVDNDWVLADQEQAAIYHQLGSGNYILNIRCYNRDGIASKSITKLKIHIVPAVWNRWWFYLLLFILAAGIIYYLFTWNYKRRKEKQLLSRNYERKIAEVEMNTLRAQMNPHFIFNSLNSINDFILSNDPDNASGYLTKFSRLMRLILDNSRSEWVILENELKALRLYIELEAVRFDNAFSYSIEISEEISKETVIIPPLIIQPYVENAIWHGLLHREKPGGRITIKIWKNVTELFIEICDNGIGRTASKNQQSKTSILHKSHGMKITAERLSIVNNVYNVNAKVEVTDLNDQNNSSGTRVLLTLNYETNGRSNHR